MFYSQRLSISAWFREWGWTCLASATPMGMLWMAHAPRETPEAAYVFLLPFLIWIHFRPSFRKVLIGMLVSGWIYHIAMVGWMRHVSFGGMCTATFLLSCYQSVWFLFARAWYSRFLRGGFNSRLLIIVGLSALWVSIEWLRTLFTLGFPWCPLAATQWERPILLQSAFFTGSWAVSFFLVFFNLCIGSYLHHLFVRRRQAVGFFNRSICPELYLGILLLFLMIYPFFIERGSDIPRETKTLKVGICQPYLLNKWIEGRATEHKDTLRKQTEFLSLAAPDIILWPEASTPYPLNLDRIWVEDLAKKTGIPILAGSVIREEGASYNAMVYIDPQEGMRPEWYAKQVLVPFGEYIPKPFGVIPGLEKLVGPVGNFSPGNQVYLFDLPISDGNSSGLVRAGILICYEDIFPSLSRSAVEQGAELLIVSTNDAWFAEEGCAEQHASHSILRAVENKVPVVRCANAGWSGWIDQRGMIRDVLLDDKDRVYFEGAAVIEVSIPQQNASSLGSMGDQFAYICSVLSIILVIYFKVSPGNRAKV